MWAGGAFRLVIEESRPGKTARATTLEIDNRRNSVYLETSRDDRRVERRVTAGQCEQRLDGSGLFSLSLMQRFALTCERTLQLCERYAFLWGLPMTLLDPGALVGAETLPGFFLGEQVFALRLTAGQTSASDGSYFFFDRRTKALLGYQLFRDEDAGEGEYVRLDGELRGAGPRLPAARRRYANRDRRFLGTEILVSLEPLGPETRRVSGRR